MKNHQKNNNLYDYQTVVVKKENITEVVDNYKCFGWEILDVRAHLQYNNLLEVELFREHFVSNKDDLQFLQVNMEADINKRGKLQRHKHSKSIILGLTNGLITIALVVASIQAFIKWHIVLGCIFSICSLAIFIITIIFVKKTFKREKEYFLQTDALLTSSIANSTRKAKLLVGDNHEKL